MAIKDPSKMSHRWHAVSVKPGRGACPAALEAKKRRWLSQDAPSLPLSDCQNPSRCACTYQHHEDRRAGPRRASERDAFARPSRPTAERRERKGRREDDG